MSKRRKNDFYPTQESLTLELLKRVSLDGTIVEPCVGEGHISNVLLKHSHSTSIVTNDIDSNMVAMFHNDAATDDFWKQAYLPPIDWTVTNPPFSQALPIVQKALEHSNKGVAMLLRLSFLEPTYDRGDWLVNNPPTKCIVLPRVSFTGNNRTDSVTCAWLIWEKGKPGVLDFVSKGPKKK